MSVEWPGANDLAAILNLLHTGDPLARSDFADAVMEPLVSHLRRCRVEADDDAYWTAAGDAVLSVINNPAVYDPNRGPLRSFLCMSAEGDLRNALKRERRHHTGRENRDCVELAAADGNTRQESRVVDGRSFDDPEVAAEVAGFSSADHGVFELMRGGERETAAFAPVLGVGHLPRDEQSRAVKRAKDRIIKRLRRVGRKA
jgi:hypothetical protein